MSFWPRLRKRSRGRRRSSSGAKFNPYATGDSDRYKVVHEELQVQRAQFASEKGVSIELVRFVSRSSRGWVYFPPGTPSASTTPRRSEDGEVPFLTPSDLSQEFAVPPPALPSSDTEVIPAAARGSSGQEAEASTSTAAVGNVVMGLDVKGDSRRVGRLVITRRLKDEAWMQISKTAAVLFVKVLVFSRALGVSTAFAFTVGVVVDIWNRGRGTGLRLFSALATQLLTTLKPYLSLQQQRKSIATLVRATTPSNPVPPHPSLSEQLSVSSSAMKVSPITEESDAQLVRSSSFAFPILTKDYVPTSPRFAVHLEQGGSPEIGSPTESVSPVASPLVESNKLPSTRPCRLRAKLFKARKGENSRPSVEVDQSNDGACSSGSSSNGSPARGKSSKTRASGIARKPIIGGKDEEVEQPPSPLKQPKKITRSHELLFFRSPNLNRRKELTVSKEIAPSSGVRNMSRSQEVRFSLKSLGKKKVSKSQEFPTASPPCLVQDLALPKSTVEGLEALAFPFKEDGGGEVQQHEISSLPSSPRLSPSKRKSSLCKLMAIEPAYEKYSNRAVDTGSSQSRASSAGSSVKGGKSSTAASSSSTSVSSSKASAMLAAAELKPSLRRVRTAVPAGSEHHGSELRKAKTSVSRNPPLPTQAGELGRSQVLGREILGSILLLAVLGFLLLGRVPAILCTSCLCLVLSHLQRFCYYYLSPKDKDLLKRSAGMSRIHHASSSPVHWPSGNSSNHGSPVHDKGGLQSSEYRKRVVIEGLLDRGNRRGQP